MPVNIEGSIESENSTTIELPDLLLGHADGAVTVVDVKAASRVDDPAVSAQFAWTKRLCDRRGFRFEVWSGTDSVLLENVRFLAGYRRREVIAEKYLPVVLQSAVSPCTVADVERRLSNVAACLVVTPVILHLLWCSRLVADLTRRLGGGTIVRAEATA